MAGLEATEELAKEEPRDSDGSTGCNSSPGAATQASVEAFGVLPGDEPSKRQDSATKVIMNLRAMIDKNGDLGLPPEVVQELSGKLCDDGAARPSEARRPRFESVSRRAHEEALAAREAQLERRARDLEEQAKRQEETARLQMHILEVEMRRCEQELLQSHSKVEALEKELQVLTEEVKSKRKSEGRAATLQDAVRRHEIAVRASFEDSEAPRPRRKKEKAQGWFSCCAVEATPKKRI
ncbi:unnamed protein product [Durusdinium trenchii]|uniref:Uncharacterized protein n=1 Tax=Durusdinium trenchii TaxID=1381693 RepID=A0ABP0NT08_9DINO